VRTGLLWRANSTSHGKAYISGAGQLTKVTAVPEKSTAAASETHLSCVL
jgi:hypothetical protein